ncbi:MAG: enoyl-CoA hydratase/isomerase family protein [Stenotrophobium sp.]
MNATAVTAHLHTLPELLALSESVPSGFSPLSAEKFLLLDTEARTTRPADQARIAAWLRQLPCPTVGIAAAPAANAAADACDVLLASLSEAAPLIGNIRGNPIAATLLVQLLRLTETMPLADALIAESLAYATLQCGPEFRTWLTTHRAASPAVPDDQGPAVVMQRDGDRLMLELNRASNRNGMSVEMRDALVEALQLVLTDSTILSVRISGRGKCFSIGGDLTEFGSTPDPATAHIVRSLALPGRLLAQCAARTQVHVHGACVGSGIEFPVFAGRVTAARDAWFQLPEIGLGLIPGAGGCISIPRRIGRQRTAWLALSGKRIHAEQALEWGLVDAIA